MTEGTPILAYRMNEYGRQPIFVVLAILLIVFGGVSVCGVSFSIVEIFPLLKTQGFLPFQVNAVVTSLFSVADMGCLVAAGIAFLMRGKQVAALLSAYFLLTLCGALVSPPLQVWGLLNSRGITTTGYQLLQTVIFSMMSLRHVIVDIILLMLLRTPAVREIIRNVTGVEDSNS